MPWRRVTLYLSFLPAACGRPATQQDCEELVERVARLQLAESRPGLPGDVLEREVLAEKRLLRDRIQQRCVGRRIQDKTLECVRRATSSEQLVSGCFD